MKIRLSDVDRDRLGCAEWLDCDPNAITINELVVLEEQGALKGPGDWSALQRGRPVFEDGQPVINPKTGEQVIWQSARLWKVVVWLGLRRAGTPVGWRDLDFDFDGLDVDRGAAPSAEPVDGEGKDQPPPAT